MERISEKQKKMKDKLTRELTMVETRLEREQAKDAELEKARLSFFPKIFSAIKEAGRKNFILEQQKKMKDTLTRALRMAEAKLSFFPKKVSAIKEADRRNFILEQQKKMKDTLTRELTIAETRLEREQAKDAELEKISTQNNIGLFYNRF